MIESMACGTAGHRFPLCAVPEVIDDGITGCLATASTRPWIASVDWPRGIGAAAAPSSKSDSRSSAWHVNTLTYSPRENAREGCMDDVIEVNNEY